MAHIENLIAATKVREVLGITANGELHMRARGALPAPIRIGRCNFYLRDELETILGLSTDRADQRDGAAANDP